MANCRIISSICLAIGRYVGCFRHIMTKGPLSLSNSTLSVLKTLSAMIKAARLEHEPGYAVLPVKDKNRMTAAGYGKN